jgi:Rod binding domain-containing protein
MELNNNFLDIKTLNQKDYKQAFENANLSEDKGLREVCNNFEAFFMNQILETSLKSSKLAGEGTGSEIFKSMYTDSLSQKSAGSMGISDMLYKFLSEKKS